MRKATDSTTEGDIRHTTLRNLWIQGASPRIIAQEMGEPIENIYPLLKEVQKALVAKDRVESHAQKKNKS